MRVLCKLVFLWFFESLDNNTTSFVHIKRYLLQNVQQRRFTWNAMESNLVSRKLEKRLPTD